MIQQDATVEAKKEAEPEEAQATNKKQTPRDRSPRLKQWHCAEERLPPTHSTLAACVDMSSAGGHCPSRDSLGRAHHNAASLVDIVRNSRLGRANALLQSVRCMLADALAT